MYAVYEARRTVQELKKVYGEFLSNENVRVTRSVDEVAA